MEQRDIIVGGLWTVVGLAGGAVLTAVTVTDLPAWLHAALLLGGITVAAASVGALAVMLVGTPQKPVGRRDVGAAEAIAYIASREWNGSVYEVTLSNDPIIAAMAEFQQAARDGDIHVWGKVRDQGLYEEVPASFWANNHLEWFSLLRGTAATEPLTSLIGSIKYQELMVSKAEIQRHWRPKSHKLVFRVERTA